MTNSPDAVSGKDSVNGHQVAVADLSRRSRAALTQTSGLLMLEGLQRPVEVLRDAWGVPHIYAQTVADLFFAQGFTAAQDRLWQMEIWRRSGEGRLAEILGPSAIERDKFARLIRYRRESDSEWESYSPDARLIIESFVRGVNSFIDLSRDRPPIEFQLLGISPEPWTPEVCLNRLAGYLMTRNASYEVLRARLITHAGLETTMELLEMDPPHELKIPDGLDLSHIDDRIFAAINLASQPLSFDSGEGSNNWVVSGAKTSSGKPILANDPHRVLTLPSLRYLVHLVGPGWNVIGAGEPALPGVAAGHNEHIAFGFTILGIDQQDLYLEKIDPKNPNLYYDQGKWEQIRVGREQIRVKGEPLPVEIELRFTKHGPVIYQDPDRNLAYALRWVGSEPGGAGYLASLSINCARNWPEFLQALERWKVPSENMVYADISGNIGWQAAGAAPRRRGWSGALPAPGDSGQYEWEGFLSLSDLPSLYNPPEHFIATANHNVLPQGYQQEIGFDWAAPWRFNRIVEALQAGDKFTVEDFERLQHDELSLPARELVPLLRNIKVDNEYLRQSIAILLDWDFVLSSDSAAAAIYEIWASNLNAALFSPLVPADVWPTISERLFLTKLVKVLSQPERKFFGARPEKKREQILIQCLAQALEFLQSQFGPEMEKWRWGSLHLAEFKHLLATDESRKAVFNLKPIERGGDISTINLTAGERFRQSKGASFRQIIDLSNWDNSVAINAPGQSGQPESPHYADLLPLWAEGKYFPLLFSRVAIEKKTQQRLVLEPVGKRIDVLTICQAE